MENIEFETKMDDTEKVDLMGGGSFIIFPPDMSGMCKIFINCNKEMSVRISFYDIKRSCSGLFGERINSAELIYLLQRGSILYTDREVLKTLQPEAIPMTSPLPTCKDMFKMFGRKRNSY